MKGYSVYMAVESGRSQQVQSLTPNKGYCVRARLGYGGPLTCALFKLLAILKRKTTWRDEAGLGKGLEKL